MPEIDANVIHQIIALNEKAFISAGYGSPRSDNWHDRKLIRGRLIAVIYTYEKPQTLKQIDDYLSNSLEFKHQRF